ncbi:NAD(P)-binding domain-containing protein [Leifsonia naganoensis]|uniref:3-hydroxyisobutyrate dehydrogenase-like beta-hydroxyacid dehydrogenase/alkylhydroperoxidase/carboxymuconolactone decarboxylase family protein YurZ n=1 Tax=Leifsonia naganoensis TaxID=150025 RepID=A0A853DLA3_9MICO|nr:NAD(P)-binding domain-containing protein [Leifsonia naganoensis]NYK09198.1 3-hydroxyisobutyrate dehydrogenase-like beta-hydroxyacid dehydrogenase/alkylhydroperoxidase/carboxymuconolactone decarboxylase family protein YurZ [Leifsonia naganoensis]
MVVNDAKGPDTVRAGVIGLGMIGGGVAVSLAKTGNAPTAVFDVRPGISDNLDGVPSQAASPAEVARQSDIVLLAVLNAAQAEEVIAGPRGLLEEAHDGLTVVLLSTVSIEAVRSLAALCADRGVAFLDAGVTGGSKAAENGLIVMVGGEDADVARALPVLDAFAKSVVHCGPLGAGMVAKLARNSLTYSIWAAVREATSIAAAGGVTRETLLEVLEQQDAGTEPYTLLRSQVAGNVVPDDYAAQVNVLAEKDLSAAQEFAGSVGIPLPIVDVVRPRMSAVYRGDVETRYPEDVRERGLVTMDRVYGDGFSAQIPQPITVPSIVDTVDKLFADVWARPYLTLRDRRLLTLGATAMLGRADLIETQLRGALANGEFTTDQLRELVLHGMYYAGWGNGTVLQGVVEKLIAEGADHH